MRGVTIALVHKMIYMPPLMLALSSSSREVRHVTDRTEPDPHCHRTGRYTRAEPDRPGYYGVPL